ncbi:hypothetical protein ACIP5Y_27645 [Nocardia sp. NPDC088792]
MLTVLEARGIEVSATTRERITQCVDPALLEVWLRRAVTAESAEELFL